MINDMPGKDPVAATTNNAHELAETTKINEQQRQHAALLTRWAKPLGFHKRYPAAGNDAAKQENKPRKEPDARLLFVVQCFFQRKI